MPLGVSYVEPSWFDRRIVSRLPFAARLMSRLTGDAILRIRGRRSGVPRTTLARLITVGQARYVVSIRGETQWARNLRAAAEAMLTEKGGRTSRIRAVEVDGEERHAVVAAFLASSNFAETRRIMSEMLPAAEQHPVFRIEPQP